MTGATTLELLDVMATFAPAAAAMLVMTTAPLVLSPPMRALGAMSKSQTSGAVIVKLAVFVELPITAVRVAVVLVVTARVFTVNETDVVPAGTFMGAVTIALALFDVTVMVSPLGPALDTIHNVAVVLAPPTTEVGATVKIFMAGSLRLSTAVFVTAPNVAVKVTDSGAETSFVVMPKDAEVDHASKAAVLGTTTSVLLELKVTDSPDGPE